VQINSTDNILLYCNIYIATNSVFIYYTRHAKYFTYSCLGLLVHCLGLGLGLGLGFGLGLGLGLEPQCLGLSLKQGCSGAGILVEFPLF